MRLVNALPALLWVALCLSCTNQHQSSETAAETNGPPTAAKPAAPTDTSGQAAQVPTDDPAVATLENGQVRFKLHQFLEFDPPQNVGLPVDPAKKYLMLDISCENVGTQAVASPAEYMLSSYVVDDQGQKHSLPMAVNVPALFEGNPLNKFSKAQSDGFNQSNFAPGQKTRGCLYGVAVDKSVRKFKTWGMKLDGKDVEAAIQ